jgi:hypothetical protein
MLVVIVMLCYRLNYMCVRIYEVFYTGFMPL